MIDYINFDERTHHRGEEEEGILMGHTQDQVSGL